MVTMPTISSVEPLFGPIAGGSELVVSGTGLDIGNTATVILNRISEPECEIRWVFTSSVTRNVLTLFPGPTFYLVEPGAQNINMGVVMETQNIPLGKSNNQVWVFELLSDDT
jgi:hypothetical protein